jgi:hypothetical protein
MKFVCVGAQKAGTTTLDLLIRKYAIDVELPIIKETKFFLNEQSNEYKKGVDFYYQTYFKGNNSDKGEIDPEYLYFEECAELLYKFNQDLKILIIVREPIKRAISHYEMSKNRGYEELGFESAIRAEEKRIKESFFNKNHFSYLSRGKYKRQICKYVDKFGHKNVKVIAFEDFVKNQSYFLKEISSFCGFEILDEVTSVKANSATKTRSTLIRNLLNKDNSVKKLLARFITNKFLKMRIGGLITRLNSKSKTSKLILTADFESELRAYYREDYEYLNSEYDIKY